VFLCGAPLLSSETSDKKSGNYFGYLKALSHEPLAGLIGQALSVFDFEIASTFIYYIYLTNKES